MNEWDPIHPHTVSAPFVHERAFHPDFLARCSDLDLVELQHGLRRYPEDKPFLDQVLNELRRRTVRAVPECQKP